jgi:PST family polysaccharide transporter
MWFFQGLEQVRFAAAMEVAGSALGAVAIFVTVHGPSDGWKVLLCQGAGSAVSLVVVLTIAWHRFPFVWPRWISIRDGFRMGGSMFAFRSAVSIYTVANAMILSFFAPPQIVGYYAGAEKISKALLGMMQPVTQALFPRMSHLTSHNLNAARELAKQSLGVLILCGCIIGVGSYVFAPWAVQVLLGNQFGPAVQVLRILAPLPLLIGASNLFGIQWLVSNGLDRLFLKAIGLAGAVNVGAALLLAPKYQANGMAVAVVFAEIVATGVLIFIGTSHAPLFRSVSPERSAVRCSEGE